MKKYIYPTKDEWAEIVKRPHLDFSKLNETVSKILLDVKLHGDAAVRKYSQKFDQVELETLKVSAKELQEADSLVSSDLKDAIQQAFGNIVRFHEKQVFKGEKIETAQGVVCWQESIPIDKVGLYIPGGTAPLFSTVLMLAAPARIAGCKKIVLCTPPDNEGKINPAILVAAKVSGVDEIYKVGGVQAIGAMAYGTESIPQVYKLFGPGNQYVMTAKQQVQTQGVAIDMPAGPSEVCVIADEDSNPMYVAADLLSQAEHGSDSQAVLITTSEATLIAVEEEVNNQLSVLPRKEIAEKSLENSKLILVHDWMEAIAFSNAYAPEHLILAVSNYEEMAQHVINAGSVFLGKYSCESAGDYASGTNHTLPTHGYAVAYSGVNLDSFCRKITFQHLSEEGIHSIGKSVVVMAENEHLEAHANAMRVRMNNMKND
ncbi:histidinol dehydrogenase [Prevotella sp. KH2C16]|uniref:histidinol dehydrogenase n=1 Tax=Prevotella sp. KH2C16 TaxID=1855325 RepID=UPI0008E8F19F|nr:histidinol dehydrogenase [Prevotella sp. KH2C16]SFG10363.1 histidinol dehydrogenase [Prevotella sp. KH2C16]